MGTYVGLDEKNGPFRVNPGSQKQTCRFSNLLFERIRILRNGNGVQVNDAENVVIGRLRNNPVPYGPQIIADVNIAGGLNP